MELSTTMKRRVVLKDAWFRGKSMGNTIEDYYLPDYYLLDEEECDDWDSLPCSPWKCGDCWGGDNICMKEIEYQRQQDEEWQQYHVTENVPCPVCNKCLTSYWIPGQELWTWSAEFFNIFIALEVYAVMDAPKGLLHSHGNLHHIWVGEGECREEKLVDNGKEKYNLKQSAP